VSNKSLYVMQYIIFSETLPLYSVQSYPTKIELVAKSGVEVGGWGSSKPHLLVTTGTTWDIDVGGAAMMASTAAAQAAAAAGGMQSTISVNRAFVFLRHVVPIVNNY
jgi:hypothetical protein